MAEGKKSFIAYCDWKETFDSLPDEKAGQLIKHIFAYVNDENPKCEDFIINAVFASIKNTLKRDLEKYENYVEKQRLNGSKGGRPKKPTKPKDKPENPTVILDNPTKPKKADSVSDSVSDSETVTINKDKEGVFKDWLLYRKEIKKEIKNPSTLKALIEKINSEPLDKCKDVINASIQNGWTGLFWDKQEPKKKIFKDPCKITF